MKKYVETDMSNQSTVFDQCQTIGKLHEQLQCLAKKLLLPTITQQGSSHPKNVADNEPIDLNKLSQLSYTELKHFHHPMFLLSEICRLLLKLGDVTSLKHCLSISHTIHGFKCQQNESWYISYLYKGIAQIGLGMTDIGTKNVLLGMAEYDNFSLIPVDKALGYWSLTSAAIAQKNLKFAQTFSREWRCAAQEGNLENEVFRATIAILLFHLIYGDQEMCLQILPKLIKHSIEEWQETLNFLADWTEAITEDRGLRDLKMSEPYPLFLGIVWYQPPELVPLLKKEGAADFKAICKIRRMYCHEVIRHSLSTRDIEQYADLIAQWELPRALCEFQETLKSREVDTYHQYTMTRFLGEPVLKKILSETPISPEVVTPNEAIILVMDVRKFSALSEHRTPKEIFDILNPVFKIMNEELEQAGGTILEFVGDCIIVAFNTFEGQQTDITKILFHTIRCVQRIHTLNALSHYIGLPEIQIGIGIHKGPVALGNLGGLKRCHLTVLGNTINLAARIESASKELPGNIIVSETCFGNSILNLWKEPLSINYTLRDVGRHTMRNIREPVHLFGLNPLVGYWVDFVPMGFIARPEEGVVYLDAGNTNAPGIIDHRCENIEARSACELLVRQPELLLDHVRNIPISHLEFRFHDPPDLDCAASFYVACELMDSHPRKHILEKLAAYINHVNYARILEPERLPDSLYGIYKAHTMLVMKKYGIDITNTLLLEAAVRVIDAAIYLMEKHETDGDFASIFQFQPECFAEEKQLIQHDKGQYQEDVTRRCHTYTARVNGILEPVTGLWLDHPQSLLFRIWAWNDPCAPGGKGYQFIAIDFSVSGKNRFVIGVNPEAGTNINGLGQLLEQHETIRRKQLGKERPSNPIGYAADTPDPWYFGQGHNYTVIDSPDQGTVLTAEEVQKIHETW